VELRCWIPVSIKQALNVQGGIWIFKLPPATYTWAAIPVWLLIIIAKVQGGEKLIEYPQNKEFFFKTKRNKN